MLCGTVKVQRERKWNYVKVACGDAVRPCLRGCSYEDMQLMSGSNEVGLQIQSVLLHTKIYEVGHTSWISCSGYLR